MRTTRCGGGPHRLAAVVLAAVLAGCSTLPEERTRLSGDAGRVELEAVPFYPDTAHYCGPAALATTLEWSGHETSPEALAERIYLPEREGALQAEVKAAARSAGRLAYEIQGRLSAIAAELAAGQPVMVLQNLALSWWPRWHYAVVVGLEPDTGELVLRSGERRRHRLGRETFLRTWARGDYWALVTPPPGALPASAEPRPLFRALAELEESAAPAAALPYWASATERWPEQGRLAVGHANAAYATGDLQEARRVLEAAAGRVADHRGVVWNNLAQLAAELGDRDAAIRAAERAVAIGGPRVERFRETLKGVRGD
ncbi:PA2778 family cysteine peptidase [Arhodomonas sp. SL1]|uniref:PA2778 family cysteine peptidase n=1 Tax=Arhodomonas sp. SL1 TaxID=3425691 RepID=UPI003F881C34